MISAKLSVDDGHAGINILDVLDIEDIGIEDIKDLKPVDIVDAVEPVYDFRVTISAPENESENQLEVTLMNSTQLKDKFGLWVFPFASSEPFVSVTLILSYPEVITIEKINRADGAERADGTKWFKRAE
jgi:hypothetical protein